MTKRDFKTQERVAAVSRPADASNGEGTRRAGLRRYCDWVEVAGAYALVLAALWSPRFQQQIFAMTAALWILLATLISGRNARVSGLSWQGLRASLWIIPAAALVSGLFLLSGWMAGTLHDFHWHTPFRRAVFYMIWAFIQEYMLQSFMFVRLESALGSGRRAVYATALLFAAAHLPNELLVAATFALSLIMTELFRRYRNLYPLAIAHGLLGLAMALSLPTAVTHNMRVGIGYWK